MRSVAIEEADELLTMYRDAVARFLDRHATSADLDRWREAGLVDRSGTIADISTACWWCGIMFVAKATSASLKAAG